MRLKLSLVQGPADVSGAANEFVFDERGGVIGRAPGCDWVLPCPRKQVSRRHAQILPEGELFYIWDASVNGLFHNDSADPIGAGNRVALSDGDTLCLGDYRLAVELVRAVSVEPVAQGSLEPVVESVSLETPKGNPADAPRPASLGASSARLAPALDLGAAQDHFDPPAAHIPDDWDQGSSTEPLAPARELTDRLPLPDDPLHGFCKGLRHASTAGLSVEAAQALGECLRLSLEGLFRLRDALAGTERQLGREDAVALYECGDSESFLTALLSAELPTRRRQLLRALEQELAAMRRQSAGVGFAVTGAVQAAVEQLAPEHIEACYAQFIVDRGRQTWSEHWRRRLNPGAVHWEFFRSWFAGQRRSAFAAIQLAARRDAPGERSAQAE